ncbi:Hypothetical Protein FCC1311_065902 [Hondaea fermentalgiana]|uniref:Uncharacterized protein n=1 Tax=Hondaea fermentalgiana TaxID=2315210 RepID=A0A2R5GPU7_9STRA|nr:Hypothetical Protein FCC1311_065902 [Hondaea fermentalgiana]|eukprot:GBG30371.1 Hypothetical Protein FCC1311_065902 [Hondaea fermentalgiana]
MKKFPTQTFVHLLQDRDTSSKNADELTELAAACALLLASDTRVILSVAPSAVDSLLDVLEKEANRVPMPLALTATALAEATMSDAEALKRQKRALDLACATCSADSLYGKQKAWHSQLLATTRVLREEMMPTRASNTMGSLCSRIVNAKRLPQRLAIAAAAIMFLVLALVCIWVVFKTAASMLGAGNGARPRSLRDDAPKILPLLLLVAYVSVVYKSSSSSMPRTTANKIIAALSRNVVEAHAELP